MAKSKFSKAVVCGIVATIPRIEKCIDNEVALYGGDIKQVKRLKKLIGLNKRYVVDEKTTTADLCENSANILFKGLKIDKSEIDALIFVSQTPDYFIPATSCYLHGKLDLSRDCATFDVNLGCSGYVYGLWLAHMLIESGGINNVVLLAGDTISKCVNKNDRSTAPLFGDAGSATLVQRKEPDNPSFFTLHTDGKNYDTIIMPAGAFRMPKNEGTSKEIIDKEGNSRSLEDLYLNGVNIFNFAMTSEPLAIEEILAFSNKNQEQIDYLVFHQANKYIITNIIDMIKFPVEKVPCNTVEKYGNQSSASIPVTICDSMQNEVQNESKTVVLAGFGVGLSWATCLITLNKIYCKLERYEGVLIK